jgi:hypothetical protein
MVKTICRKRLKFKEDYALLSVLKYLAPTAPLQKFTQIQKRH